jgi:hypothetical protein
MDQDPLPSSAQLAKLQTKDFLDKWTDFFPIEESKIFPETTKITLLLRFIRAARTKKMLDFGNHMISLTDSAKVQLQPS